MREELVFFLFRWERVKFSIGSWLVATADFDKIDDIFKPYISSLFELEGETYKAIIAPYLPKEIEEMAKETAIISEFNYQTKNISVNSLSDDRNSQLIGSFNVKIIIHEIT